MNKPAVSIVIPCYNVEKYLKQCLDSVVNQTLRDIEIICVNDGSTDSTLSILKQYADADDRIRIIDKTNSGYGHSMNCGFDDAKGEYIGIVESDDYVDPTMFQDLYTLAKQDELDVIKSGFYFYYSKPKEKNIPNPIASPITDQRIFCPTTDFKSRREMAEFFNLKPTIWSAIYRADFIRGNHIRFHETPGASYQDASFNFKVWACAKRVRLVKECYLHYRQDNEASSINSPGKVYCICDEYEEMQRFLDDHQVLKGLLEPVMVRIKYDSYMWNYVRLSEPLQAEFIQRFQEDFRKHEIDGTIHHVLYETYKLETLYKIITDGLLYHKIECRRRRKEIVPDFYRAHMHPERVDLWKETPFVVRKIIGAYYCVEDHGWKYTVRHAGEKVKRRLHK